MQAIPSVTPLSRTAFCTSSVMSLTVSPPAVRRRVSCWNTFIVAAILRESLPDAAVEPSHPQWILQVNVPRVSSGGLRRTSRKAHLCLEAPSGDQSSAVCDATRPKQSSGGRVRSGRGGWLSPFVPVHLEVGEAEEDGCA
jgi:hypothetical protein